jgi:acetyltransferase-like isoleucine patch superfamily enzyme
MSIKAVLKNILQAIPLIPEPQHPSYQTNGLHIRWKLGWLRAQVIYRPYWTLLAKMNLAPNIIWGKRVSFLSPIVVFGNGTISFGDDTIFDSVPNIFTHHPAAKINIGANCFINASRIASYVSINIGANCILANCRMMDTDFHSVTKNRLSPKALVQTAPIQIDQNVWIAADAAILKGVHIGENSVIAFGSVVVKSIPENSIAGGNPAKVISSIPE